MLMMLGVMNVEGASRMRNGTFYLNNSGSRWVSYENGSKVKTKVLFPDGHVEERTILYYESFGNWAVAAVKIKGKTATYFMDSTYLADGSDFIGIILKESQWEALTLKKGDTMET